MLLTAMRSETPDGEAGPTVEWAFSVELVARFAHSEGYKLLSLMRASLVVKCH
jgi:hypothetical protein